MKDKVKSTYRIAPQCVDRVTVLHDVFGQIHIFGLARILCLLWGGMQKQGNGIVDEPSRVAVRKTCPG